MSPRSAAGQTGRFSALRLVFLIALREYMENVRTKGFWLGVLLFPVILLGTLFFTQKLATSVPTRHYLVIDQSGMYGVPKLLRRSEELLRAVHLADKRDAYERRLRRVNLERQPRIVAALVGQIPGFWVFAIATLYSLPQPHHLPSRRQRRSLRLFLKKSHALQAARD